VIAGVAATAAGAATAAHVGIAATAAGVVTAAGRVIVLAALPHPASPTYLGDRWSEPRLTA
jgi:hypothetical protein